VQAGRDVAARLFGKSMAEGSHPVLHYSPHSGLQNDPNGLVETSVGWLLHH
jgi:sucrose-6-phosphate hydrolase SacC (GH32 family)